MAHVGDMLRSDVGSARSVSDPVSLEPLCELFPIRG
jgi:hypothetical protein